MRIFKTIRRVMWDLPLSQNTTAVLLQRVCIWTVFNSIIIANSAAARNVSWPLFVWNNSPLIVFVSYGWCLYLRSRPKKPKRAPRGLRMSDF